MENTFYYLLTFVLVMVICPILSRKLKSGKTPRDFEFKRRSGKVLDNFDEENNFVDNHSR